MNILYSNSDGMLQSINDNDNINGRRTEVLM